MTDQPDQPNKPDGALDHGEVRPVEERQAVKNQSTVTPEDYPEPATVADEPDPGTQ